MNERTLVSVDATALLATLAMFIMVRTAYKHSKVRALKA